MSFLQSVYEVVSNKEIAPSIFDMEVLCPDIVAEAREGQFVHVRCGDLSLRRPISICSFDRETSILRLTYIVKGEGTKWLSRRKQGDIVDILGPLGNGFSLNQEYKNVILVGGGIGVPPMFSLSRFYGERARAIYGFRNKELIILDGETKENGSKLFITTDDGSFGRKGFVTDELREQIKLQKPDMIYACGPSVMLRGISAIAIENGIPCQVSMEERMACGVGACLGCATRIKNDDGVETYKHVCKDGPVFDAKEVVF